MKTTRADLVGSAVLAFRPRRSLKAENLGRRRRLALYKERGSKPRRIKAMAFVPTTALAAAARLPKNSPLSQS